MQQTVLTFITKINPDKRGRLVSLLEQIQNDRTDNSYIPFASLRSLHFASFVISDDDNYDSILIFENNFDGSLDDYSEELCRHAGAGLHEIYGCCFEYPAGEYDSRILEAYLKSKVVRPNAFHIGNVGRGAERIRREIFLRRKIENFLDEIPATDIDESIASLLCGRIQAFARGDSSLAWAAEREVRQTLFERVIPWLKIVAVGIGALVLLPVIIIFGVVWLIILRRKENRDPDDFPLVPYAHVRRLVEREDRIVQNHLASITEVKPGWVRRFTLRLVLWLANLLARTSNKGELSGIPSIHFAHWSLIDEGRRLLFLSNYDGSWGSYLDDFIDKASLGLTAIWSNTVGFPPTEFLAFKGARNGPKFKSFARRSQTAAIVWYCAYPDSTVRNINDNSAIREDLFAPLNDEAVEEWLERF